MPNDWLRKAGTNEVFVRTPILAELPEMHAISEEEAMALRKAEEAKATARRSGVLAGKQQDEPKGPVVIDPLAGLSLDELRAKAAELKIHVNDKAPAAAILKKLRAVMANDAETLSLANGNAPTRPAAQPEAEAAPEAPAAKE